MTNHEFKSLKKGVVGKPVSEVQWPIKRYGYETYLVPEECVAIAAIARPKTIVVWQENGNVRNIEMGDPCELKD